MIKLPRLTWELDCAPIGYPGLGLVFWLNPPLPAEETQANGKEPWNTDFYRTLGRILLEAHVPASMSDKGVEETVELGTAEAGWRLERLEPQLPVWGLRQYSGQRQERLQAALKN